MSVSSARDKLNMIYTFKDIPRVAHLFIIFMSACPLECKGGAVHMT